MSVTAETAPDFSAIHPLRPCYDDIAGHRGPRADATAERIPLAHGWGAVVCGGRLVEAPVDGLVRRPRRMDEESARPRHPRVRQILEVK